MGTEPSICLTICAQVIISRAAEACSTSSAPKSTGIGSTLSSAELMAANSTRRRAGSSGGSAMPRRWRTTLWICAALSRTWVWASARPCPASPARAMDSARRPSSSAASMKAGNSASSGAGVTSAVSRRPIRAWAKDAACAGSGPAGPASGHAAICPSTAAMAATNRSVSASVAGSSASWRCRRASCSRFISSRSRSVSHQPISVRPSVS